MLEAEQKFLKTLHEGYVRKIERELKEMTEAINKFESEYSYYGYYNRYELGAYWEAKRKFDERMHWFRWWAPSPTRSLEANEYLHRWYSTLYNELIKSGVIREY